MTAGIRAWLIAWVADRTGSSVDPDRPLHESGLSSRESMELAADLGRSLGRPLAPTLVWEHPTIAALADHLSTVEHDAVADVENREEEPIAIVGLGCRLPGGTESPEQYWRFLDVGGDGVRDAPEDRREADFGRGGFLDDIAGFDADFFGIVPGEAEAMDPQQRMLLEVTWAALEHAGIPPSTLRGSRTGVFVGLSAGEYGRLTMTDPAAVDVWSATGAATSIAANRLSYLFDLRGPSLTLDTACSSSLVAVHQAVQSLRRGECATALVAGVNLMLTPAVTETFRRAGVLAPDGHCKPFDAAADGIVRGEGCGVVVLKPLKAARRAGDRVLAVIRGSAVNSDGRSNGLVAPSPGAQAALLRDAYAAAGVEPSSVDYVEAHGTGTELGDPIEAGALGAVLGAGREPGRPLLIGSVKGNLGHLEGAAGIAGLIKVVLAMVHRRLPPTPHYREPSPHIDFAGLGLRVVGTGADWPRYSGVARAGISAFGFGGTNAHIVVEEWPATSFPARRKETQGPQVLALSAQSPEVLRARAADLADWLEEHRTVPLDAVAATLARGRDHLPVRGAVVAGERDRAAAAVREMTAVETGPVPDVVFVFSGYGSQWPGMGRLLLRTEPAFRTEVEALDPVFREEAGFSLREVLSGERDLPDLGATQLALFGMQLALAGLWRAHGVVPDAVLGHSMGEVAAAVVAGALDVADGLRVMTTRARLLAEVDASGDGAMAVVELSPAELADLEAEFPGITVAVYASPVQCTVSGDADQVEALVSHVESLGRLARRLPVGGAGHSEAVDAVLGRFRAELDGLSPRPAEIPCYSSVLDDPQWSPTFDVEYWAANLRRPVRFSQALAAATADGYGVFVEISPHPVALAAIEQSTGALALPSASRKIDERIAFLATLARLHTLGVPGVLDARGPRPVPVELPGPRWRHRRFWPRRPAARSGSGGTHPLLGVHIEQPTGDGHLWNADVGTEVLPWLADHAAMGVPLFPAAGFLELALAAAKAVRRSAGQLRVGGLELHRVLPLAARTEVTTSLSTGSGPSEVDVYARSADGGWTRHATARVRDGETPVVPFGAVGGDARPVDLYRMLAGMGQSYGPAFRGLSEVVAVPGRASASITLPADDAAYVLHPVTADACLHALAAAAGDALREADGVFLPLTLGEVVLAGDPRRGVRVDAVLDSLDPAGDGLVGGVQLVDADDVVLVEFREVYCRRFQRSALPVPMTDLLFETVWRRAELPVAEPGARTWVLLHDDMPWPAALRDRLAESGDELVTAPLGDRAALAEILRSRAVAGVLVGVPATDPREAARTVATLSGVVAELAEAAHTPRLWLVSAGASAIEPGERGDPGQAWPRGLVRVLAFEHPGLRASQVDFDAEPDPARLWLGRLVAEIRADAPDDEIAWREGVRYTRVLARPELGEPEHEAVVREGAYIITGGLGGLGLVAADWLANRGATRVVLSGRRGAGPEAEPMLADLRDLGADVRVVAGDIAEPGTAEALIAAATEDGVPLRGVLHAAGVLSDGAAASVETGAVEAVWRAKALGAWRLHEATAGHELDWWLTYSSAAALFGSPGQAAYATANAWVDALVSWRRAGGLPAATIGWGAWGEAGAAVGNRNPVLEPLGTGEALAAMDAVLKRDRGATGIARVDAGTVLALFPGLAARPFFEILVPKEEPGAGPSTWDGLEALRAVLPEAAREMLADYLAGLVAGMLGLVADGIDRHVPLTGLGLDSLTAMRAKGVVERDFGLPLPIPLLLRGASLAELADHLADQAGFGRTGSLRAGPSVAVGPRDPAERWVARHWQAELGGAEPGVHDDFFAAGGDAEAADRLRAVVAGQLGAVPDRLFATPTIAAMADLLRDRIEGRGDCPVRPLREGGADPLFLFHPAGGPTSVYDGLVRLLPEGRAVYGLERIDDEDTVEGKAECYLELIREIQPQGPYRLGGWSFGGCLAYETARRLTAAGERVDLVVMIDSILPSPAPGIPAHEILLDRFDRFAEHVEQTYGVPLDIPCEDLVRLDDEAQIRLVIDRLAARVPGMGQGVLRHQYESYVDARVAERYAPEPYTGRVLLVRAQEPHPLTTTLDPRYLRTDDALGWDAHCADLEIVRVPGDHLSMIDPPHVAVVAEALAARLAAPRAARP
ncbi:type I polyketide synthase [Amycolatopsis oliviviridis]|uniref:Polyketide synthase n=1 Tax=Amycolatopsis oliviviridis TaxID=1471590 RepID=A0ABQ3L5E0_9PSEU|nr:type I polyketide synthase [Amycolatopsis oliviviridis]GHH01732.1 polyketide synthase [Amycolatopsis oliviviridis]